jgi:hypothetical protein
MRIGCNYVVAIVEVVVIVIVFVVVFFGCVITITLYSSAKLFPFV